MKKLAEHTLGSHMYMKIEFDDGSIEEVDVCLTRQGEEKYRTTADNREDNKNREQIIKAFQELY